jgi:isoleucyl-tRNA synthetase
MHSGSLYSPLLAGEDAALIDKDVADINRKLSMIWNVYDFFTMYAEVDKWESPVDVVDPSTTLTNPLDTWVVSRVHQLSVEVDAHMQAYDFPNAMKPILPFVDDLSNWYVRRSRRRFWKAGDDSDKNNAYTTLHYVLVTLAKVMAPFTPFLAEELYRNLTGGESVHLLDWPEMGVVDEVVVEQMQFAMKVVNEGLSIRAKSQLKVRQPLASVTVNGAPDSMAKAGDYEAIILDELNIHELRWSAGGEFGVELDKDITPELKREGLMREVIRQVQEARKAAGLDVDDRIQLALVADGELGKAIEEHALAIATETLVEGGVGVTLVEPDHLVECEIEGSKLTVSLSRV